MSSDWFLSDYKKYADSVVSWNRLADGGVNDVSLKKRELQRVLVQEEWEEVLAANRKRDKEGFLKELCDLFVVLSYQVFLEYHGAYKHSKNLFIGRPVGTIHFGLQDIGDAIHTNDCRTALKRVIGVMTLLDADVKGALQAICDNNMSKFTPYQVKDEYFYGEEAISIEVNSQGRYRDISWEMTDGMVIFRDGNNKIMKPLNYKQVSLKEFING